MSKAFRSTLGWSYIRRNIGAFRNYWYDFMRFRAHSSAFDPEVSAEAYAARITKEYHRIEKGMALPEPRPGFGADTIEWLMKAVPHHEALAGSSIATRGARGALCRYVNFHDEIGQGAQISDALRQFAVSAGKDLPGGTNLLSRQALSTVTSVDFDGFARARFSVRHFTGESVAEEDIRSAVATALKSPRVCNRESRRVRAAFSAEARERVLSYQNGNRGFGHLAGAVLIVTSDLRCFTDFGERNQSFVDGGLFSTTLALALHAKGYGTCFLNWSAPFWRDRQMRSALSIPDNEVVITLLAVGRISETFLVAASPGPDINDMFSIVT